MRKTLVGFMAAVGLCAALVPGPAAASNEAPSGPWAGADVDGGLVDDTGNETLWSTCSDRPYTFAVNPGKAPKKMVRWGTRQFLAAAEYAHLDVSYVGFTDLDPVPAPQSAGRPDFILSFDYLAPRYSELVPDYFVGWTETAKTGGRPANAGRDFGLKEIVYKGAVLPWTSMKQDEPADRRAKTLHMVGFMLGLDPLDGGELEVMRSDPKGGGKWTPWFSHELRRLYPAPYCPRAPRDLDIVAFDSNWRGIDVEFSARPSSGHPFDRVIAFEFKIDYAEGYDTEDIWFPNLQDRGDGRVRMLQVELCAMENIPAVVTVTAFSRYGLVSEPLVQAFPQGLADC